MRKSNFKTSGYDGSTDVEVFVREYEMMCLCMNWDANAMLANVDKFLHGKAKRVYDATTTKTTWAQVVAGLRAGIMPPGETLMMQFYSRVLGDDESITEYALALQTLLSRAMPLLHNLSAEYELLMLRTHLCLSLPRDLQVMVNFTAKTTTFDELMTKLDQCEHARSSNNSRASTRSSGALTMSNLIAKSSSRFDEVVPKTEPVDAFYSHTTANRTGNNRREQAFDGDCDYCGKFGHKMSKCFKRIRDEKTEEEDNQSSSASMNSSLRDDGRTNGKNSEMKSVGFNRRVTSNNVDVDVSYEQFPFVLSNSTTVHNNSLDVYESFCNPTKVTAVESGGETGLLHVNVSLWLFKHGPVTIKALLDGGSSHSFISPTILSDIQVSYAKDNCKRGNYRIAGATGVTSCQCCLTNAKIQLGSWSSMHEFIIADPVRKHEMIIGRDFLKKHGVLVNHANDSIVIANNNVHLNTVEAIGNVWLDEDFQKVLGDEMFPSSSSVSNLDCNATECSQSKSAVVSGPVIVPNGLPLSCVVARVVVDVVNQTQQSMKLSYECSTDQFELFLFRPVERMPYECLVTHSAHTNGCVSVSALFCNIVYTGMLDVVLKSGHTIAKIPPSTTNALCGVKVCTHGDIDSALWLVGFREKHKEKFVFSVDDDTLISSVSHNRMTMFHARGGVLSSSMPIPTAAVAPTKVPKQRAITAAAVSRPKRSEPLVVDEYEALTEPTPTVEAQVPETTHGTVSQLSLQPNPTSSELRSQLSRLTLRNQPLPQPSQFNQLRPWYQKSRKTLRTQINLCSAQKAKERFAVRNVMVTMKLYMG